MAAFPQIPGYEIQAELGRGGMAVVYSAIESDLDRPVAIKVVLGDDGDPDGHIQRLENEARGLAALHHPHIVDLYRFGRLEDGSLYYVMPLLPGGSLEDRTRPMPEAEVVTLLDNLLDALAHAHAADIIHRDIKPANILFDRFKRPMLADFGAAFMRQRETRLTTHGGAIGSSGYMSPEQARGHSVDERSDLYSTAVLAFELLTGARPFEGPDGLAVALAQLEKPVPRLPEALKHWQAFFDKALAVNPAQRFANAMAMRAAIYSLRHPKPAARHRVTALAAALGAALVGVLVYAAWNDRHPAELTHAAPPVRAPKFGDARPLPSTPASPASVALVEPVVAPDATTKSGDRLSDPGGPELVIAKAATSAHAGLAVMAAPVDVPMYQRFARQRHRAPLTCARTAAPAQGCLGLSTANDIARWLSEETGKHYRVPARAELAEAMAQVARANAYAWTGTCHEVRVAEHRNVAQRGWARVRKAFGKPKPAAYDLRCEGNYTLKLDGRGEAAVARDGATPETVVVLVRDLPKAGG